MDYTASRALFDILVIYAVVIVVSLLVAVVIRVIVWTLSRQAARAETAKAAAMPAVVPRPAVAALGLPAEHLVAIAAAVAAMTGAHRIVRIEPHVPSYGWTAVGRATHQTSHTPRRGR